MRGRSSHACRGGRRSAPNCYSVVLSRLPAAYGLWQALVCSSMVTSMSTAECREVRADVRFCRFSRRRRVRHAEAVLHVMGDALVHRGPADGGAWWDVTAGIGLAKHPAWRGEIDRDELALFMRHNAVPAPWSIYRGIYKLPPAHYLAVRDGGWTIGAPQRYWNLPAVTERGVRGAAGTPEGLVEELDALLHDTAARCMMADVPLGAFLSGGYDSTTVVALMQAQSARSMRTFTIGFHEEGYDEAQHAKAVARHLGTAHTELYVTPAEALAVIPRLPEIYDEPFADSSQIPTYLVSALARRHVTVALLGDGGDELFYGYTRYFTGARMWRTLSRLPLPLRRAASRVLRYAPGRGLEALMGVLPHRLRIRHLADCLSKLSEVLAYRDGAAFYRERVSHWKQPDRLVLSAKEPQTILSDPERLPAFPGLRERMMLLDMLTYVPDDILTKVDCATMAVSLEARVPLLDHRVVEFAWRVPTDLKDRDGQGKWLLRQVLYRYVPRSLMERPKMGFGVPIEDWLRESLREWGEALLDEKILREEGFSTRRRSAACGPSTRLARGAGTTTCGTC